MVFLNKKSQIVIFIFLGLVIAISLFLFLYLRRDIVSMRLTEEETLTYKIETEPIYSYVQGCMKLAVSTSLTHASLQGGLVNTSKVYNYIPLGYLKVPYYFRYNLLSVPPFTYIVYELEKDVLRKINYCLKSVEDLPLFSKVQINIDEAKISLTFSDYRVLAVLNVPITVSVSDKKQQRKIEEFAYEHKTAFYKMYKVASAIANYQAKERFLEQIALETIAAHLPYKGVYVSFSNKLPTIAEARDRLFSALFVNYNLITFIGFKNIKLEDYIGDFSKYYSKFFSLPIDEMDSNIEIKIQPIKSPLKNIQYTPYYSQDDDYFFSVSPSTGDRYMPMNLRLGSSSPYFGYIPVLPLVIYDYKYNVNLGNLVTLYNSETKELFLFGLRTELITFNYGFFLPTSNEYELENIDLTELQSCEGEIEVRIIPKAIDKNKRFTYPEADVYYQCADITCYLGRAEPDEWARNSLTTKIPVCYNPIFLVRLDGFYFEPYQYTADLEELKVNKDIVIAGEKYVDADLILEYYYNADDLKDYILLTPDKLFDDEQILIKITNSRESFDYIINNSFEKLPTLPIRPERENYTIQITYFRTDASSEDDVKGVYFERFETEGYGKSKLKVPVYSTMILENVFKQENIIKVRVE
ncbi:MAG: hypothetical protein QW524_01400 [Candidatus Woesearchaeota archaeon]